MADVLIADVCTGGRLGVIAVLGADAVQQQIHDLRRRQRLTVRQPGVGTGERDEPEEPRRLCRCCPERVPVGEQQVGERVRHLGQVRRVVMSVRLSSGTDHHELRGVRLASGWPGDAKHPHDLPDALDPPAHRVDGVGEHTTQGAVWVDGAQVLDQWSGVQHARHHRGDHRLLVRKDPEDRALGDAGGFRDLPRRHRSAVVADQGHCGGDDGRPAFVRGQGGGTGTRRRSHEEHSTE